MEQEQLQRPDYIFEVSWEVCNKVGGIHTVIATKTLSLVREWGNNYILIGPDVWKGSGEHPEFTEDPELFKTWKAYLEKTGLKIKIGRWKITGNPLVVLVDFTSLFARKNEIFKNLWLDFQVDSLSGQWDYIEPALFGYAAGQIIESFYQCHLTLSDTIIAQFHEWLTAAGILYLEKKVPQIATIFTTHATIIGRTIAGNDLPFYSHFEQFNADQEAKKWNIVSKHSLEKAGAKFADCFTTVSEMTARECRQFLERTPDVLTPNGFDDTIVPDSYQLKQKRLASRKKLFKVAEAFTGITINPESLLILKSGRYEFRNKGIDVFIQALGALKNDQSLVKDLVAFICIPAHQTGPRSDIRDILEGKSSGPVKDMLLTHHLQGIESDPIVKLITQMGLINNAEDRVKVFFVPVYLDGEDGIFNVSYYDLLPGFDIAVFPSYYEPWGYTPLESLAFHVPAITTDVAGFGHFIKDHNTGVYVLHRDDNNKSDIINSIAAILKDYAAKKDDEVTRIRDAAFGLSKLSLWKNLIIHYEEAYSLALQKTSDRQHLFEHEPKIAPLQPELMQLSNQPVWRKIYIQPTYPEELQPLEKLARNLWWSWHQPAIELFKTVDPELWQKYEHDPIAMLNQVTLVRIKQLVRDKEFLSQLAEVDKTFEAYMKEGHLNGDPSVAYFCMEYGLDSSLKLYSGGLGILAGDYLKQASDSAKNIIGVGLLYRKGYFKQHLSLYGDQLAESDLQKFTQLPMEPLRNKEGEWVKINIALPGRTLYAKAWRAPVGRTSLYLLDADIPENRPDDRMLTDSLYGGDVEYRLKQELLLGIGGVRLLHTLGIHPDVYHCNEGHAAFLGLERIYRAMLEENIPFDEALEIVRASTLFTTHTPVDAGQDRFREELLRVYLGYYIDVFNIPWQQLMGLGKINMGSLDEKFSMSFLAARLAQEVNGVSLVNEGVSRKIFHGLWPSFAPSELHIGHVTNAVHYYTWASPEWQLLFEKELGKVDEQKLGDTTFWAKLRNVSEGKIWRTHALAKKRLIHKIREKITSDLTAHHQHPGRVADSIQAIDENALFIGFARRIVPYKRATLLFHDLKRLAKILSNEDRPVIILFAGKAHPQDAAGQDMLRKIVSYSYQKEFLGKIIFLENYDIELAKYLVQGVDLWLNTPQRGMEASGTSGMKASMNGVLNFSILDGWWSEAYDEKFGWALGDNPYNDEEHINEVDAEDLYRTIEMDIVPAYFERNDEGIPQLWIDKMKNTLATLVPTYNTSRMLRDYEEKFYKKLYKRSVVLKQNNFEKAKELVAWKNKVKKAWPEITVRSMSMHDTANEALELGAFYQARIEIYLDGLSYSDIGVEIVFIQKRGENEDAEIIFTQELKLEEEKEHSGIYTCKIPMTQPGVFEHSFRFFPKHPLLPHRQDFPLMIWL